MKDNVCRFIATFAVILGIFSFDAQASPRSTPVTVVNDDPIPVIIQEKGQPPSGSTVIYMYIDGIEGDVTAAGHEGWIEVFSLAYGNKSEETLTPNNSPGGAGVVWDVGEPVFSHVTITKTIDRTTPKTFELSTTRNPRLVQIDLVQTGPQLDTFMEIDLEDSLISSYKVAIYDGVVTETVTFVFQRILFKYTPYDNKHNPGGPIPAGYDITIGKKI